MAMMAADAFQNQLEAKTDLSIPFTTSTLAHSVRNLR